MTDTNETLQPEQPDRSARLILTLTPDGNLGVQGGIAGNALIALGMLELAKVLIVKHHQQKAQGGIEPVPFMPPGLLR
jgi:hypothetical protein